MTERALPLSDGWIARLGKGQLGEGSTFPVSAILAGIVAFWYLACLPMNANLPQMEGVEGLSAQYAVAWGLERPVLPAPHQVIGELYRSVFEVRLTSPRNLAFHAWVTLSSTLLGFVFGVLFGILLAVGIVHSKTLNLSLMPWIIASQTVPILAIAPIVIVALGSIGLVGLVPKAIISAYLCFFPVTIGLVKGFTSPEVMHLDLMKTYNAGRDAVFFKLRWPAAIPFLFASLKVAVSIALVGAIVAELPTGAQAGLGARLLSGSYYGQTVQIWAALFAAAFLAAALVGLIGAAERVTMRAMGGRA